MVTQLGVFAIQITVCKICVHCCSDDDEGIVAMETRYDGESSGGGGANMVPTNATFK